jgi:ribonuclease D
VSDFTLVTERSQLEAVERDIRAAGRFAIDTESASFHRYTDRVYLVQLATETAVWIVDPLALDDLAPLGRLLADPEVEATFHDADFDLRTLHRDYGFTARTLFDTRVAADLCGEPGVGLAALLERYFDVTLDKRYQRADWSARPLADEMLGYAADDTRYLVRLRDLLGDRLAALERSAWAEEEFARLESLRWEPPEAETAYERLKGAGKLNARQRAALRELHQWRDGMAEAADRSPFRIAGNDVLVAVATALPRNPHALRAVAGMPPSLARRRGEGMLAAVERARALSDDELPRRERARRPPPDETVTARFDRLRTLRTARADAVGLAPGLVCPNATLMAMARAASDGPVDYERAGLKRWQRSVLGTERITKALADVPGGGDAD